MLLLNSASSPQQQAAIDGRLEAHRSILFPISQFPVSHGSPFGSNKIHGSVSLSSLSTLHFALLHARHITLYRSTAQFHTLSTTSLVHPTGNFRIPLCTLVSPGCYHGEQLQVLPASPPAPPHLQRPTAKGTPRLCTEDLLTLQPSVAGNHTTHVARRSPSLLRLCLCTDCPFTCHSLPHLS